MHDPVPVFVICGPTAVGKGTVVKALKAEYPQLEVSVSATTRPPRPGEVDGRDYYFVDEGQFARMRERGELLESAVVHGAHSYGTPRGPVEQSLAEGKTVLLEIDLAGARQVRQTLPEARFIFLLPPSWEELERRLIGRGTEGPEERSRRLKTARVELDAAPEFDVCVINDKLDETVKELAEIMGLN